MLAFCLRRLVEGVVVLLVVVSVIFVLAYIVGNPANAFAPTDASQAEVEEIRRALGLDAPLHVQAAEYFGGIVQGDFGTSIWQQRPAMDAVLEALPETIQLSLAGILVAALLGASTGIVAGARPNSVLDRITNFWAVAMVSLPNFWLGLVLIAIFAVQLGLFPTSGFYTAPAIVLPALTIGLIHGGRICLVVRSATFEEVTKPYVQVARSKGLPHSAVVSGHVLRNAGVTIATTVGWEYVRLMGGAAFVIEIVFAWPGVGRLMITAANREDFPVLQAAVIVMGAFVVLANMLVDIASQLVDRRLNPA